MNTKKEIQKLVENKLGIHGISVVDFWKSDTGIRVVFRLSRHTTIEDQISLELTAGQLEKIDPK